jgi:hypothetical protein
MIRLASVIDSFEKDFRAQYGDRLNAGHMQALAAIKRCRTGASAKMQVQCSGCEHQMLVPHSCGHRHCPHCQHHESQQWLERQLKKQVPAGYFLITFTLPAQFRPLAFTHQTLIYDLLMRCSWDTVRTFSGNDKRLQGTPGATAVLHTHSRQLDYHPHVHLLMPAAAVDATRKLWRTKRGAAQCTKAGKPYLFNHKALAKVFRAKMLVGISAAGLTLPACYPEQWVVDCKSVGSGATALIYLGRYLYRGVIRENDIIACANGVVTFRYRDAKTGTLMRRTVPGAQFLWLVLQHVLPKGFRRARNFGFLHPNCKRLIALLHLVLKFDPARTLAWIKPRAPFLCSCCGAVMTIVKTRIRSALAGAVPVTVPIAPGSASAR